MGSCLSCCRRGRSHKYAWVVADRDNVRTAVNFSLAQASPGAPEEHDSAPHASVVVGDGDDEDDSESTGAANSEDGNAAPVIKKKCDARKDLLAALRYLQSFRRTT
eukprot:Opistho-2@58448